MAFVLVLEDLDIPVRLASIRHRPEHRVGIVRIDILVDRDHPFALGAPERGDAVERAPDLGARHIAVHYGDDQLVQAGERFMGADMLDALDAEMVAQMLDLGGLVGRTLDGGRS